MDPEIINQQQQLLATYRRTLAHYLMQQAIHSTAYIPPSVTHGIEEARDNIHRIKALLSLIGVKVEDHPDDEIPQLSASKPLPNLNDKRTAGTTSLASSRTQVPAGEMSLEAQFWFWFESNSERLMNFTFSPDAIPTNQDPLLQELSTELAKVAEGLTFELSSTQDFGREFIVSADGDRKRFSAVIRLLAAAPSLPSWKLTAFRPPMDTSIVLNYGGHQLSVNNIWFTAMPNWDKLDLTLYIKGLTKRNLEIVGGAAFIMLDAALGEEGFNPWFDEENLLPGQDWRKAINKAVQTADVVLVCLSSKSLTTTGYLQQEIDQIVDIAENAQMMPFFSSLLN